MSEITDRVRAILDNGPLFMDTETTGTGNDDEVVEIAMVDVSGKIMCNTLVRSQKRVPPGASKIHGISDDELNEAPNLDILWQEGLQHLFTAYPLCIYNIDFDLRMMQQSLAKYGIDFEYNPESVCVMRLFAEYRGELNSRGGYKWFKLMEAAKICGLSVPEDLHRALADSELTRRLLVCMGATAEQLELNV